MKKNYEKPVISTSSERKFEKVYSGGCTKQEKKGCSYMDNIEASTFHSGSNSHKHLDPGYNPDGGDSSN